MSEQLKQAESVKDDVILTAEEAPEQVDESLDLSKRKLFVPDEKPHENVAKCDETAQEESPETLAKAMSDYIRTASQCGKLVTHSTFSASPFNLPEDALDDACCEMKTNPDYGDIHTLAGKQTRYYYSSNVMTENYARMLMLVAEDDTCQLIAQVVRFESETYPRPYKLNMLTKMPYLLAKEQMDTALELMEKTPEYQDIGRVVASNDEPYLYSNRFMSYGRAKGLCEWIEVEQFENP